MLLDALIMIIIRFWDNTDTKSLDVLGALLIITCKKVCATANDFHFYLIYK